MPTLDPALQFVFHDSDGRAIVRHPAAHQPRPSRNADRDMIRARVPQSEPIRCGANQTAAIFRRCDITQEADRRGALRRMQAHREAWPHQRAKAAAGIFDQNGKA